MRKRINSLRGRCDADARSGIVIFVNTLEIVPLLAQKLESIEKQGNTLMFDSIA